MSIAPPQSISVVTVTYADRITLLEQVAQKCFEDSAIADLYIVSNNSSSDLSILTKRWGNRIRLISLDRNSGSAVGYSKGIAAAVDGGSPYIMLLDDDNAPASGCTGALHAELERLSKEVGVEKAAVMAPRDFHRPELRAGTSPGVIYPRPSSFMGFNLFDKLVRRQIMRLSRTDRAPAGAASVSVPMGPYGGLLAARSLYQAIGLPEERLVLYFDDSEYTYRITQSGGSIRLVFGARIEDLDGCHSMNLEETSSFMRLLTSSSTFRLYYAVRNAVWFAKYKRCGSRLSYWINRTIYMTFMRRVARQAGWPPTYNIFCAAVRDGEADKLGNNQDFPLP